MKGQAGVEVQSTQDHMGNYLKHKFLSEAFFKLTDEMQLSFDNNFTSKDTDFSCSVLIS